MIDKLTRRSLRVLEHGPCPLKDLVTLAVGGNRADFDKAHLTNLGNKLRAKGLVRAYDGKWYITDAGRTFLNPATAVKANLATVSRKSYSCPELGQTCLRPGAYDFLGIPSVFASERRPYKFKSGV